MREAPEFLSVSQSACRLWIAHKRLKAVRCGRRVLLEREYLEQRAATGELQELIPTIERNDGSECNCTRPDG